MNSNFKILLLVIISFSLGMMAMTYLSPNHIPQREIHYTQEQKLEIADQQLRKPFFIKIKERSNKIIEGFSNTENQKPDDKPIVTQLDFINLREKVDQFENKLHLQLKGKFKRGFEIKDDPNYVLAKTVVSQNIDLMFIEKRLFYRANLTEDSSEIKIVLFFNYYTCEKKKPIKLPLKFDNICYMLKMHSFIKNEWSEISVSSSGEGLIWKDTTPFAFLMLSGLGDFAKITNANMAVIPVPSDEESNIQFLKFIDGQFKWTEGATVKWNAVSSKDVEKFEAWTHELREGQAEDSQE